MAENQAGSAAFRRRRFRLRAPFGAGGAVQRTRLSILPPLAAKASLLHFNGDLKPWALTAEDARNWHLLGLRRSSQENVPHAARDVPLEALRIQLQPDDGPEDAFSLRGVLSAYPVQI